MDIFPIYLSRCSSLEIVDVRKEDHYEIVYKNIDGDFFRDILHNRQVYHALRETMIKVINRFSFELNMCLKFFRCMIDELTGFSDLDTIYVNVNRYTNMYLDIINTKKVCEQV